MDNQEQKSLLKLARDTISHALGTHSTKEVQHFPQTYLHEPRGVFVTLHKHGQLRGCIGSIMPVESVLDGVRHNAIHAAQHDSRFPPVTVDELADIDIEISVLTNPEPLPYNSDQELLQLLSSKPGVILRQGHHQATFLPQVWKQLADPRQFLEHLSLKAGLSRDGWQQPTVEISTYTVECFGENELA